MLAASSNTSSLHVHPSDNGDHQQLQDLESLAQRLRALEAVLGPLSASKMTTGRASNGGESPVEETAGEDAVVSVTSPSRRGGDYVVHHHSHHTHHGNKNNHHNQNGHTAGSLSRRIQKIETSLWAAAKERKPTEEFLLKYEASNLIPCQNGSHSDRELLTLQAKTELILAAQEELQKLSEESKDIQSLQRCAEIGGLKNVESQYPILSKLETIHIEQSQESNKISDKMNKLTDDYNGLINTLSEVFLSWDALLTAAELKVSEVERSRN
ncbi:hypothetical protein BGX28_003971 [Mortierella sp. GBA30]|nr:hypothetical protein BGX28_003971 [Mortierella sp. GBA30]